VHKQSRQSATQREQDETQREQNATQREQEPPPTDPEPVVKATSTQDSLTDEVKEVQTTRLGRVINMLYTENAAYLFQMMIDGLVACTWLQEEQYRFTYLSQTRAMEGLPPTIGECIHVLKAKKYHEDNSHFNQAMNGKYSNEYKASMESEVNLLEMGEDMDQNALESSS